jgi:hypothetical protein
MKLEKSFVENGKRLHDTWDSTTGEGADLEIHTDRL